MDTENRNNGPSQQEQLKKSVAYIATNEAKMTGKQVSPEFIQYLVDTTYKYIVSMADDLESFASHQRRNEIQLEDVLLCARRNESLLRIVSDMAEQSSNE